MLELFLKPESWAAVATLVALEVVLGIDNLVFIAIIASRLPKEKQELARKTGLAVALFARLALLLVLSWLIGLERPLIWVGGFHFSGKELILLAGGLFLLGKSTKEIYVKTEMPEEEHEEGKSGKAELAQIIAQIVLVDMVFSIDSLITAVGIVKEIPLIAVAIVVSVGVMLFASGGVTAYINKHPSLKMLALAFLLLIGVLLVAEGTGQEFDRNYVYFAMAFSLTVEILNLRRQANLARNGRK